MENAIGYVRVSTDEQSASRLVLADQRERVEAYCLLRGLALVRVSALIEAVQAARGQAAVGFDCRLTVRGAARWGRTGIPPRSLGALL